MDFDAFQSLCRYVGFGSDAAQRLGELLPRLRSELEPLIEDFYAAIAEHPEAHAVITEGPAQVQRLRRTLFAWLESLLGGTYDAEYVERRSRIGRVHVEIGLPQQFMFGALNRLRVRLARAVVASGLEPAQAYCEALHQILDLELALMLDTYREESNRRIRMGLDQANAQSRLIREYETLSRRLEDSERQTRAIIDGVPAFVACLDEGGRIAFWNRQLERVTGFAQEEMLGKDDPSLFAAGPNPVRLPLKAGGHRLARWQRTRVESEGGGTTYLLGVDVTDEAEMQRRANRAERLAAVGTLAAGLAHEVRNPLNSASLQLQSLRRRVRRNASEEEIAPIVGRVQEEIQRLDGLVDDFLAFARPGALQLADTDLNSLVRELATVARPTADAPDVDVRLELDPAVGQVRLDAGQIRQVVHALIRNATQAMPDGGTLTLRTRAADAHALVTLEVHDTGAGFPESAPVFDAFYTTKSDGTGLGLAIVHRIVQEHGGSIEAESTPGDTSFRVRLPQPKRER